jgi:hypothetical protein
MHKRYIIEVILIINIGATYLWEKEYFYMKEYPEGMIDEKKNTWNINY